MGAGGTRGNRKKPEQVEEFEHKPSLPVDTQPGPKEEHRAKDVRVGMGEA